MRRLFFIAVLICLALTTFAQVTIQMKREGGVSTVPCKVNGLNLKFIFDTGASDVSISMTEASFMLKNEYLSEADFVGKSNYLDANGNVTVGVNIILREIEIGGLKLFNVKAGVVNNMKAPLLLGQSAISKLGVVQLNLNENTITILDFKEDTSSIISAPDSITIDTTNIVENEKDKYEELYRQVKDYYEEENYQQAIAGADLLLNEKPNHAGALFYRAVSYDMLQDYKSAIADYTSLIELKPNVAFAYCYRGKSKYDLEDYSGALVDLNKGLLLDNKYTKGYRWRADTKEKLKNIAGAIEDYSKAILFSPQDSSLYVSRAFLKQELNDYSGAIIDCNKALSINSDYANAYYYRGVNRRYLKQYTTALEDLNKAIELDPELPNAYAARASIKEDVYEDFDGALEDYNKSLELNPNYLYAAISKSMLEDKIKKNIWISVGTSSKGDKWYIHKSPVSTEYSSVKIWVKTEMKTFSAKKNGKSIAYTNCHSLMLCQFDCTEREYKILSYNIYNASGSLIHRYEDGEYESSKAITPETMMENVFTKACNR